MRRICAIILLLVLTAQAQAPTGVILIILRQVEQCLLTDALESVQTANLTRTAWTAARGVVPGMPPPQADWSAFERAFSALPANQAPAAGEAALRAMVDSLNDPYSTVVTPAERQARHAPGSARAGLRRGSRPLEPEHPEFGCRSGKSG